MNTVIAVAVVLAAFFLGQVVGIGVGATEVASACDAAYSWLLK